MRIIDPILMELEQEAAATRRLLERVPEDRLGWRPHPKSMSLGQLALHIAITPGQVAEVASLDSFEMPSFSQAEATSRQEVLDAGCFARSCSTTGIIIADSSRCTSGSRMFRFSRCTDPRRTRHHSTDGRRRRSGGACFSGMGAVPRCADGR
jgi:hypothetical protein